MMSQRDTITYEMNGEMRVAAVKEGVPFAALLEAISAGVDLCYAADGTFRPELEDFAIEYVTLQALTDIDIGENAEDAYRYIRAIDGVPTVDADFIADGIRACLRYREKMLAASMQSYGMSQLIERIDGVVQSMEDTFSSATKLIERLAEDAEKASDIDLKAISDALTNGKIDEKKIASAVLDFQEAKKKSAVKPASKKKAVKKPTPKE